jgi:hypothetical protein
MPGLPDHYLSLNSVTGDVKDLKLDEAARALADGAKSLAETGTNMAKATVVVACVWGAVRLYQTYTGQFMTHNHRHSHGKIKWNKAFCTHSCSPGARRHSDPGPGPRDDVTSLPNGQQNQSSRTS